MFGGEDYVTANGAVSPMRTGAKNSLTLHYSMIRPKNHTHLQEVLLHVQRRRIRYC